MTINSTLGRHLIRQSEQLLEVISDNDPHLVTGVARGRALIICNRVDRPSYKIQLDDAQYVMERQFGLEVSCPKKTNRVDIIVIKI